MNKLLKWPWLIIGLITIVTVFFALQIPGLKLNNEVEIFLPDNNPAKTSYNKVEDIYGGSEVIDISIESKSNSILNKDTISIIKSITDELSNIDNIDEVTSLTNADYIEGTADGMKVSELVKKLPENNDELFKIKEKLLSWDMYKDNLYSDDLKATQLMVKLKKDLAIDQKEKIYYDIKNVLHRYEDGNLSFYIAGSPALNVLLGDNMESDLKTLIPFVVLVVLIALYLSFRNWSGVILPLLTVAISSIWALGLMSIFNINMTIISTVIPVLLVAVGSAYGIHIISHYFDEIKSKKNGKFSKEEHKEIVVSTIKEVGKPVLAAGITTIVGFASLSTSNIIPIKQFGIFTAIGVATAVLVAVTLIPAILLIETKSRKATTTENKDSKMNKAIIFLYHYFGKKKIRILVLSLIIVIAASYGMSKIVADSIMIQWFKPETEIRQADEFINSNFAGDNILNITVSGKDKGSLTNPEVLVKMEDLGKYLTSKYSEIGKVVSFTDYIKRMNKVMNYPQDDQSTNIDGDSSNINENTSNFSDEDTSSFGKEDTSNFGGESTSSFGTESTTDFSSESTSSFGSETTSSFGDEGTSDFGQSSSNNDSNYKSSQETPIQQAPSNEKISEKELLNILNMAIIKAEKLNLTGEELVEAVNRELNYQGEAYNEIPYDPSKYSAETREQLKNLISQYLLMYSGNLDDLINDQLEPSGAKMTLQIKSASNILTNRIKEDILQYVADNFPEGYQAEVTGVANLELAVNNLIVSSQIRSIIVSLIVVFLIVAVDYKSMVAGLYGIIPLAISVLINFGIMGYAGIKLDIATSMVASIAIGIGVDYTIHFLSSYYRERKESSDLEEVCQNTLLSTGKAIIFNALSVAAGFAVLLFSNFNPLVSVGLLVAVTMLTSSLAAMTILPALLNLFKPKFISK